MNMPSLKELLPKAVELFKQGKLCSDVARELGVHPSKIVVFAIAALLKDPTTPTSCGRTAYEKLVRVFGPDPVSKVRELIEQGKTWREIARMLGYRNYKLIAVAFNLIGIKAKNGRRCNFTKEQIEKAIEEAGSCRRAAKLLGTSEATFYRLCKKYGIICTRASAWWRWFKAFVSKVVEALERVGGYTMNGAAFLLHTSFAKLMHSSTKVGGSIKNFLRLASKVEPRLRWMYIDKLGTHTYGGVLRKLRDHYIIWLAGNEEKVAKEILSSMEVRVPWISLRALLIDNRAPPELIEAIRKLYSEESKHC